MMSSTNINEKLPAILRPLAYFKDYLMSDHFIGGPQVMKLAHIINLFKAGTLPFCIYLMNKCNNWGPTMMTYTALHGSYGILWLIKEYFAPDRGWQKWVTIPTILATAVYPLGAYWYAPFLIASFSGKKSTKKNNTTTDQDKQEKNIASGAVASAAVASPCASSGEASPALRLTASILYGVGAAIMFGSDIQKYFLLQERPGLITNGFFAMCRHPNYLGEMMLYGSFALLTVPTGDKKPWAILSSVWGVVFVIQMLQKEARMSRHAGWAEYAKNTAFLIPGIF